MFRICIKTVIYATLLSLMIITPAWALEGELGYAGMNRTETVILKFSHKVGSWNFNAEGRYGETDDVPTTNQGYFNAIYEYELSARCSIAGGNKAGFNAMRNINLENFFGGGPKCYLYKTDKTKLSMSIWYLSQYTEYSDKDNEAVHRMSYRPKFSWRKGVHEVKAVFYYQPASNPNNYITVFEASYNKKISDTQSVGLRFEDEYRSTAEGEKHEWIRYIVWSFKPKTVRTDNVI